MIRQEIKSLINQAILGLQKKGELPSFEIPTIVVERPENEEHGDCATNIALQIGKKIRQTPLDVANIIAKELYGDLSSVKFTEDRSPYFPKIEVVKPGFINFYLSNDYLQSQVAEILKQKAFYGDLDIGTGRRVQVEFISANPTGPLTLGNGRGGFCGDVLANVLAKAGYKVQREYYINDRGEQIKALGHSVTGDDYGVYKGDYIDDLRKKFKTKQGDDPEKIGEKAAKIILDTMIKPTVKKIGIKFDKWFSEKSLYKNKEVDKVLTWLKKKKLACEKDGALWFKSTQFGDDKDRVLVKADGEKTYFASDVAYTKNKFERGFDKLIYFWGADHYGYVPRMQAVVQALGYKKEQAEFIVMQLVRLFRGGKEVRMSKRDGVYVTLDELFDELCQVNPLGMDVARFFFLTRAPNTHLNFDLDLAKTHSEKNPVYYVQYAYVRIHSILAKSEIRNPKSETNSKFKILNFKLKLLEHPSEVALIKQLIKLPEVVEDTAKDYQVQRLPQYAKELATTFHQFYTECRVLPPAGVRPMSDTGLTPALSQARLALVQATKIVLKNILGLMGISAPEKM